MRALVTRPNEDAEPLAAALRRRGIEPLVEPLLSVVRVPGAAVTLDGVQAILVTSRNGVRALAEATGVRDVPVFAVGEATAELARARGFGTVESAGGDARALAALVAGRLDPAGGPLVHAAGHAVAGDLGGWLAARGFEVRRAVLYETVRAAMLSAEARDALAAGCLGLALFFSPRTAETFVMLVRDAGLGESCRAVSGICLSPAVARELEGLSWRALSIAERPDTESMLAAVDAWPSQQ